MKKTLIKKERGRPGETRAATQFMRIYEFKHGAIPGYARMRWHIAPEERRIE